MTVAGKTKKQMNGLGVKEWLGKKGSAGTRPCPREERKLPNSNDHAHAWVPAYEGKGLGPRNRSGRKNLDCREKKQPCRKCEFYSRKKTSNNHRGKRPGMKDADTEEA